LSNVSLFLYKFVEPYILKRVDVERVQYFFNNYPYLHADSRVISFTIEKKTDMNRSLTGYEGLI
jgi:hypothetical protein